MIIFEIQIVNVVFVMLINNIIRMNIAFCLGRHEHGTF